MLFVDATHLRRGRGAMAAEAVSPAAAVRPLVRVMHHLGWEFVETYHGGEWRRLREAQPKSP